MKKSKKSKLWCEQDMILRDHLAVERTGMANERTLLSYLRTALLLLATGLSFIKILKDMKIFVIIGLVLVPVSILVFLTGLWSFIKTRRKIDALYQEEDGMRG